MKTLKLSQETTVSTKEVKTVEKKAAKKTTSKQPKTPKTIVKSIAPVTAEKVEEKVTYNKESKGDSIVYIDPRKLYPLEGLNTRVDYGDLFEDAVSIALAGIHTPLVVLPLDPQNFDVSLYHNVDYKKHVIVEGHRRDRCIDLLFNPTEEFLAYCKANKVSSKELTTNITTVPCIVKDLSLEEIMKAHILSNKVKPFTTQERMLTIERLVQSGTKKQKDLAKLTGVTVNNVSALLRISKDSETRDKFLAGKVTFTKAVEAVTAASTTAKTKGKEAAEKAKEEILDEGPAKRGAKSKEEKAKAKEKAKLNDAVWFRSLSEQAQKSDKIDRATKAMLAELNLALSSKKDLKETLESIVETFKVEYK